MVPPNAVILLVEDDANDIFFPKLAFEDAGIPNRIVTVTDGGKAIDYLSGVGEFSDVENFPLPCLVLLDLKLPVKMGLDVLRWAMSQPDLRILPFIILSSSAHPDDVRQAYEIGARAYLTKPVTIQERLQMTRAIAAFWLECNHPIPVRRRLKISDPQPPSPPEPRNTSLPKIQRGNPSHRKSKSVARPNDKPRAGRPCHPSSEFSS